MRTRGGGGDYEEDDELTRKTMTMVMITGHEAPAHLWLLVVLHGEGERVEHDGGEHRVLAHRRGREGPQLGNTEYSWKYRKYAGYSRIQDTAEYRKYN